MTDELKAGESLAAGDRLVSANGSSTLLMQGDGNMVLYRGVIDVATAYWSTDTWALPTEMRPVRALMQADGHFVLYDAADTPRWGSGTWGPAFSDPRLHLQNDGNLVIRDGNLPVWASGGVGGVGAIGPMGFVDRAPDLDEALRRLGHLPPVVTGPSDLGSPSSRTVDAAGVAYAVVEQRRRVVNEIVEQAYLQDIAAMGVWPGNAIQGRPLLSGDVAAIGPLPRAAGTINVVTDLISHSPNGQSAPLATPTSGTADEARRTILNSIKPTDAPGSLKVGIDRASTLREVGVRLGVDIKGSTFGVDANASLSTTYKETTAVAVIRQIFYSATFDPGGPGARGFWAGDVEYDDLAPYVGAGNPPLFVDSVQYGRLICITAQGAFSSSEFKASLEVVVKSGADVTVKVEGRNKEVLESSTVKVYTMGVPGAGNVQTLSDPISDLQQVYRSGLMFTSQNPGAPVSFTARHVGDNTLARVALSAEYIAPLSALGADVPERAFSVWDGPGGGLVDTGIQVNPSDTITISTSGRIWSGVIFSQPHGPEGWPGHKPDPAAPAPEETGASAYSLVASSGGQPGSWFQAGPFWQGSVKKAGRLLLNINDNNPHNGDPKFRWTSRVSVKRGPAGAAGVFI